MCYCNLFVRVAHKRFSLFMGSCLIYFNWVIAGLIIQHMYEMLQHPVHGALSIIMKKRAIATMTRGTKCYILLQYLHTTFLITTGLVLVKIYTHILGVRSPHVYP